ncbi:MAG: VOC family protein [Pirellulales bacterium]|nr:VOC family protein [Pirellulales bacterium]
MHVLPYLYFNGRCEEALNFYQKAIGAEIAAMMRFSESPEQCSEGPAPPAEKIMHAEFNVGSTKIMASDGMCTGEPAAFQGISLSLAVDDVAKAEQLFHALGEGGQVQMPMTETFFSPRFGMVADKFGVSWMVIAFDPHQMKK